MSRANNKHTQHTKQQQPIKQSYYEILGVDRNAKEQIIKQSYKKLALKYHPDKNSDKQTAKKLFTDLSEAYTVLVDPKKREMYDMFGTVDEQMLDFDMSDLFSSGHYNQFEAFIDEMMDFPDLNEMKKMFGKGAFRGGARRAKHAAASRPMAHLSKMFEGFSEESLNKPGKKKKQSKEKTTKEEEDWETESQGNDNQEEWASDDSFSDDQDKEQQAAANFMEEQLMFPLFVSEHSDMLKGNIQTYLGKKKGTYRCTLDKQQLKECDLFDHFDECHRKQYKKWSQQAA